MKVLWQAVLAQAARDAVEGPAQFEFEGLLPETAERFAADIQAAAREWIADEVNEPRRFVWVCETLGFDPVVVRDAINRRIT